MRRDDMDDSDSVVILITVGSGNEATQIAKHLVESRLAACVQMLDGIESVYRWEGKIESGSEVLLLAKTTRDKFEDLEATVRSLHSYQTPEIIAIPIIAGSAPYMAWLNKNLGD